MENPVGRLYGPKKLSHLRVAQTTQTNFKYTVTTYKIR